MSNPTPKTWGYLVVVRYRFSRPSYVCFTKRGHHEVNEELTVLNAGRNHTLAWFHMVGCTHYKETTIFATVYDFDGGATPFAGPGRPWGKAKRVPKYIREGRY